VDTHIHGSAHHYCRVHLLASKKFGRQASFSNTARNRAQLFPLGFELLEFIVLAARKNETVKIFSLVHDSKAEVLRFLL
jgi:hypothetical protein